MVVLFDDCCHKIELQFRHIKLQVVDSRCKFTEVDITADGCSYGLVFIFSRPMIVTFSARLTVIARYC